MFVFLSLLMHWCSQFLTLTQGNIQDNCRVITTRVTYRVFYNHKGLLINYTSKVLKLNTYSAFSMWSGIVTRSHALWQTTLNILNKIKLWIIHVLQVTLYKVHHLTQCNICCITVRQHQNYILPCFDQHIIEWIRYSCS
jgi:hypothetical protein